MEGFYKERYEEMQEQYNKCLIIIAILIIAFMIIIVWDENHINEQWEEKWFEQYKEVYSEIEELENEIVKLAEKNDYLIENYDEQTYEHLMDDGDYYPSGSFESVFSAFYLHYDNMW